MEPHEFALEFMRKAKADEYTVDKLIDDPEADDSVIGFHCQQAAEKLLKAVLIERGTHFQKSHSLTYLIELINTSGEAIPLTLAEIDILNPFAVTLRYETLDAVVNFDRQRTRQMVEDLRAWVEERLTN